ncbi:hypothetical protein [Streptomyces sp. NPDC004296]|uniref:hypothetical protein n=1 Tax=Streptomyces sp. NPDC004296 TaxID=3364697 RepID=UPI003697D353
MSKSIDAATRTKPVDVRAAVEAFGLALGDLVEYGERTVQFPDGPRTVPGGRGRIRDVWAGKGEAVARVEHEDGSSDAPPLDILRPALATPCTLGHLPASADVPQVKAALRLLIQDGQPLAAFDERDRCISAGAYLDPRRETGDVVLEFVAEHWPAAEREELCTERVRVTREYADLFRVTGWTVQEFRERDHTGRERLARLILTPPAPEVKVPTARERMTAALAEYGITAHHDDSWLVIPVPGSDFPGVGTPQLVAYIYEAHEDWVFVDAPMEHWAGTWQIRFNNGAAEVVVHRCDADADPASATAAAAKFVAAFRAAWGG